MQKVGLRQTPEPVIVEWAAQQERVVVLVDKKTLAVDAWDRVAHRLPMPDVVTLRPLRTIGQAIREREVIALAGISDDLRDQVGY